MRQSDGRTIGLYTTVTPEEKTVIDEKMDLDVQVSKLKMLKANHTAQQYDMQDKALKYYPRRIAEEKLYIEGMTADLPVLEAHPVKDDAFTITILGKTYTERKAAGEAIIEACKGMITADDIVDLGEYRGFDMKLRLDGSKFKVTLKNHLTYSAELSDEAVGNIQRINNGLEKIPDLLETHKAALARYESEMENAREEAERPFPKEAELQEKMERLNQLNHELEGGRSAAKSSETEKEPVDAPAPEEVQAPDAVYVKPSIRDQLRSYPPPARVAVSAERSHLRETTL